MKTLDDVLNEWDKDAPFDRTEPSLELSNIPKLLAKYLRARSDHKIKSRNAFYAHRELKRFKREYYLGRASLEDLKKHNVEQFPLKLLREEVNDYLEADGDLNKINVRREYHEEIVAAIETIIKELNNRSWQLRAVIQWETYSRGVG